MAATCVQTQFMLECLKNRCIGHLCSPKTLRLQMLRQQQSHAVLQKGVKVSSRVWVPFIYKLSFHLLAGSRPWNALSPSLFLLLRDGALSILALLTGRAAGNLGGVDTNAPAEANRRLQDIYMVIKIAICLCVWLPVLLWSTQEMTSPRRVKMQFRGLLGFELRQ